MNSNTHFEVAFSHRKVREEGHAPPISPGSFNSRGKLSILFGSARLLAWAFAQSRANEHLKRPFAPTRFVRFPQLVATARGARASWRAILLGDRANLAEDPPLAFCELLPCCDTARWEKGGVKREIASPRAPISWRRGACRENSGNRAVDQEN